MDIIEHINKSMNRSSYAPAQMMLVMMWKTLSTRMSREEFAAALITFTEAVLSTDVERETLRELLAASWKENDAKLQTFIREQANGR